VSRAPHERVLVNVGCGPLGAGNVPAYFDGWKHIRVDIDAEVKPDILADLTDLSPIPDGSADAVWAAHCVEHLYEYQVTVALAEFRRVLRDDGFVCVIVPDLQTVGSYLVADQMHEPVYQSAAGPVTPHDILFGFGAAIADGRPSMAHRCGFTPSMLQRCFQRVSFAEVMLRRRGPQLELAAVARATPAKHDAERMELMGALGL
jgi:SAM-dependent methyltransferase